VLLRAGNSTRRFASISKNDCRWPCIFKTWT
jgi:hypothetical protein